MSARPVASDSASARERWTRSPLPFGHAGVVEVGAAGDADAVDAVELGGEHPRVVAGAGVEGGVDVPVGGDAELHPLALLVDHQAGGDGLHAAGGEAGHDLLPQHRGDLVAVEAVEDAARLLGLDEVVVDLAGVLDRGEDRGLGDLVEDHPVDRQALRRLELVEEVPRDGLALAVLIGGEVEGVGVLDQLLQLGDVALLVARHDVVGLEAVVDVDREAAPRLVLDLGRACPRRCWAGRGCDRSRTRRRSPCPGSRRWCGPWPVTRR